MSVAGNPHHMVMASCDGVSLVNIELPHPIVNPCKAVYAAYRINNNTYKQEKQGILINVEKIWQKGDILFCLIPWQWTCYKKRVWDWVIAEWDYAHQHLPECLPQIQPSGAKLQMLFFSFYLKLFIKCCSCMLLSSCIQMHFQSCDRTASSWCTVGPPDMIYY